jgi:8-oxo-dGTP pyrophosphatase MutT (NUDIX family)
MRRMGPAQPWPAPHGRIPAAVLVPLFEEDGESRVILTRRSDRLRSHTGEVSFPGGRLDPGEAPVAAALREAGEEIGLDPASVEILGQLAPLATLSSRSSITPFVGVLAGRPALSPNPAEVELAFDVSLAELATEGVHREEHWHRPELTDRSELAHRAVHFFELRDDTVWGATARILHQFLELVLLDGS